MIVLTQAISGLGLFLLGMVIMTDSLRSLAGEMIRGALMRYTYNPLSGAAIGALSTAILQSSSATTVAVVGFVGAGLMTFTESLGIIFGANIGTTITGWLVALIGFKFKLGVLMQPIIFIGVVLRIISNGRMAKIGMAIAGFGLIFVGISAMQAGMSSLQSEVTTIVTPDIFPTDSLTGRLKLVSIGIIITIITQSSSAGVAAALTALFSGAIDFGQAASLVIGMDVGTTVTTAIATIGGSVGAKRTGFSHVIYNVMTAIGALFLLTPYILFWELMLPGALSKNSEIALVGFHSLFNILGVIVILPFTRIFGRFIQSLIPDKADAYTKNLDRKFLVEPDLALTAAQTSIHIELKALLKYLAFILESNSSSNAYASSYNSDDINMADLRLALAETHVYIDLINLEKSKEKNWKILLVLIHCLDHMQRLYERCDSDENKALIACKTPALATYVDTIKISLKHIIEDIDNNNWIDAAECANQFASAISKNARKFRKDIAQDIAEGKINISEGTDMLEAIRWLRRVSAHILRITHHQEKVQKQYKKM